MAIMMERKKNSHCIPSMNQQALEQPCKGLANVRDMTNRNQGDTRARVRNAIQSQKAISTVSVNRSIFTLLNTKRSSHVKRRKVVISREKLGEKESEHVAQLFSSRLWGASGFLWMVVRGE